jgi:hypothetical protein
MQPSPQPTCPSCQGVLRREDLKNVFACPHCNAQIRFSRFHMLGAVLLAFGASLLVTQYLGLKAYAAAAWIPIFAVCFFLVTPLMASLSSPLKVDKGGGVIERNLMLFLSFWFGLVVTALSYGFVVGWLVFFSGAPRREVLDVAEMWSVPLGLFSPAFVVRPDKSLAAVVGIVSANSYFWAIGLTLVFKFVHGIIRRSRVTQLGISDHPLDDGDDEI